MRCVRLVFLSFALLTSIVDASAEMNLVPPTASIIDISVAAVSPDGRRLLTAGNDSIYMWDTGTGNLIRTFRAGDHGLLNAVAFSADGLRILSGYSDVVRVWDAASGARVLEINETPVLSTAFSPDRTQLLTRSSNGATKLWDANTGAMIIDLGNVGQGPTSLTQDRIATAGDRGITLWDAASGKRLRELRSNAYMITSLSVSSDGRFVVASELRSRKYPDSSAIALWDVASGKKLRTFCEKCGDVELVRFSPDGRYIHAAIDTTLQVWEALTGKLKRKVAPPKDGITTMTFSDDGAHVLFGQADHYAELRDGQTNSLLTVLTARSMVTSVAFAPGASHAVAAGSDSTLRIWDMAAGRQIKVITNNHRVCAAMSNGQCLSYTDPGLKGVAVSPDGSRAAAGFHRSILIWDVASGGLVKELNQSSGVVLSLQFSRDGGLFLSSSNDGTVRVWDTETGALLQTMKHRFSSSVYHADFSLDGRRIIAGMGDSVVVWDVKTGVMLGAFEEKHNVSAVAISPDSTLFLDARFSYQPLRLRDLKTGQVLRTFSSNRNKELSILSVAFSPDGSRVIAGCGDGTVRVWDTGSGRPLSILAGHEAQVSSVALSADGNLAISSSKDTTIRLWNLSKGKASATFVPGSVYWLATTPEGFFNASAPDVGRSISMVRGLEVFSIDQIWQSLFNPDLVREKLDGDPHGLVAKAAAVTNIDKVIASGVAPSVVISSPISRASSANEIITVKATITAQDGGIGRIEWRVNGITVGVSNAGPDARGPLRLARSIALDPGDNTIEVVAYNSRNLLASVPARTTVSWTGTAAKKPTLHVLAIGINRYVDDGGVAEGATMATKFPPLGLAVADAKAFAGELRKAGRGIYGEVKARTVLDEEATADNLDAVVAQMAMDIEPRDTFVFYAASHGYSHDGRFYLIPQDYQGGADPRALRTRAIDQVKLQDWIVNRVKAKKALILIDSCESGALTAGYTRSRFDAATSDAAIGRLHEATGRPVLTAAGLGQSALEFSDLGHGVFTSALIDAFYRGDVDGNGVISVSELVSHVQNLVPKLITDPKARSEVISRGAMEDEQSARFGGRGEDFALVNRLQ